MTLQQLKEKYNGMSYTEIRKLVISGVLMYAGEGSERGYISKKLTQDDIKAVVVMKGKRAGQIKISLHNPQSTQYQTNIYFKEVTR